MKILFTLQPGVRHLLPLVPLARALESRGHHAVFATAEPFLPEVQNAGFDAVAAGPSWAEADVERTFPRLDPTRLEDVLGLWESAFALGARTFTRDLVPLFRRLQPSVVVSGRGELCAPLVAERVKIPYVVFGNGPCYDRSVSLGLYAGPRYSLRAMLGLPPDPEFRTFCPYLYLDAYPASLQPTPPTRPVGVAHAVRPGPLPGDTTGAEGALEKVPTIVVTMGAVFDRVRGLLDVLVAALADEPVRLIVAAGRNHEVRAFASRLPRGRVVESTSYSALFAGVHGVVCHGGHNTTTAALAHGVPLIGVPLTYDQQLTSRRVAESGAGLCLERGDDLAARLREAVRAIISDPRYTARAAALRREIEGMPGPESAAVLVERAAEERRPIVAA